MSRPKDRAKREKLDPNKGITSSSLLSQVEYPVFCLHYVNKKWCLTLCDVSERVGVVDTFKVLSEHTWQEIISKHLKHYEIIKYRSSIKHIPNDVPSDATIIAFRFGNRKRMVGFRKDCIFHIVWFDPKFKLYNHGS